jgi:ribosomal protein S18 acetylase RimI-like enzyme
MSLSLRPVDETDEAWVRETLEARWGEGRVVSRGAVWNPVALPGLVAEIDGRRVGLLTYRVSDGECEIVTLDALEERRGIGTALVTAAVEAARGSNVDRVWLITTNDNLDALRFYQRRGFALAALHRGALADSRRLKPSIPDTGAYGIPIRDELELERRLHA